MLRRQVQAGISSAYETTILDATVEPNRISGTRGRQGVLDCLVSRMSTIEYLWAEAPRALDEFKKARKDLDDCRRANPCAPR